MILTGAAIRLLNARQHKASADAVVDSSAMDSDLSERLLDTSPSRRSEKASC